MSGLRAVGAETGLGAQRAACMFNLAGLGPPMTRGVHASPKVIFNTSAAADLHDGSPAACQNGTGHGHRSPSPQAGNQQ
jgi:hypothetical protein